MLRSLFLSFFLAGGSLSLVPTEKPPSSLEPTQSGRVTFTHTSERVIGCSAKGKGKDLKCVADKAASDASTSLVLRPSSSSQVAEKDKRQPVTVSLPASPRPVEITLGSGVWEIDWSGRSERERFYVGGGDSFNIGLASESGSCKRQKDDCLLATDKTTHKVAIPKECRR
jgi:hypothetical protein